MHDIMVYFGRNQFQVMNRLKRLFYVIFWISSYTTSTGVIASTFNITLLDITA